MWKYTCSFLWAPGLPPCRLFCLRCISSRCALVMCEMTLFTVYDCTRLRWRFWRTRMMLLLFVRHVRLHMSVEIAAGCFRGDPLAPGFQLGIPLQNHVNSHRIGLALRWNTRRLPESGVTINICRYLRQPAYATSSWWPIYRMFGKASTVHGWTSKIFTAFLQSSFGYVPANRCGVTIVKAGGLSLTHFFVPKFASRFFFLRDQCDHFLRSVVQSWRNICVISLCSLMWMSHRGLLAFWTRNWRFVDF